MLREIYETAFGEAARSKSNAVTGFAGETGRSTCLLAVDHYAEVVARARDDDEREVAGAEANTLWRFEDLWQSHKGHQPRVKLPVSVALRPPALSVSPRARGNASLFGGAKREVLCKLALVDSFLGLANLLFGLEPVVELRA